MSAGAISSADFERQYNDALDHDPWRFSDSDYEQGRYQRLLHLLPRARYRSALEPGCSIGVLTEMLARRCDRLLAMDVAPTAVGVARERLAEAGARSGGLGEVDLRVGRLPHDLRQGDGPFDLIVLSEIGYYFDERALAALVRGLVERLLPGGDLIAVHWTGASDDHLLGGERTNDVIASTVPWPPAHPREGFSLGSAEGDPCRSHGCVIDRWTRP